MNKKILVMLSLVLILCIGTVSAFDLGSILGGGSDENETVTVEGFDFNIPEGFSENPDYAVDNETVDDGISYKMNGKSYEKGNDVFVILVTEYEGMEVTDEVVSLIGGDSKTINGIDGYLKEDGDYQVFSYPKDGKLIVISATDEDIIGEVLMG